MPDGDLDRTAAWSRQLAATHARLRDRLRHLQTAVGAGTDTVDDGDLLAHCLGFCSALTTHHEGEDSGLFTELVRVRPDLAATVGALQEDHWLITQILGNVQRLAEEARDGVTVARREQLKGELDGLAAIMESHFRYEERAIGAALDRGLTDTGWTGPVFTPETPGAPQP